MTELRGLGEIQAALQKAGGTVLGISSDPVDKAREVHDAQKLSFPLLSDSDVEAITAFGVLHEKGPRGRPIAIPANFLIDRDGRVAWEYISARVQQRMNPADLLKEVQTLAGS
ncbi:MAG: redoxin domain-containing protein [Phycisphaerales bacterium]|nr:MAG: redoxin domain-containing protein [Phycisphaerales bacterium]